MKDWLKRRASFRALRSPCQAKNAADQSSGRCPGVSFSRVSAMKRVIASCVPSRISREVIHLWGIMAKGIWVSVISATSAPRGATQALAP